MGNKHNTFSVYVIKHSGDHPRKQLRAIRENIKSKKGPVSCIIITTWLAMLGHTSEIQEKVLTSDTIIGIKSNN